MADARRVRGEQVKCHECGNLWPREQGGLQCPRCDSEFVEIISDSNPPSPQLPPRPDSIDGMRFTGNRSLDSLENQDPWREAPDPDDDDIDDMPFGGARPQPGSHHYDTRSSNGHSSFSISMISTNGGPMRVTTSRSRGGGQLRDPATPESDMVQAILGMRPLPQNRGPVPGHPPIPGYPFGPANPHQEQGPGGSRTMALLGLLLGLPGARVQVGTVGMDDDPFAVFHRMLDPANAAHGDAVFTQEALDRVMTQLMEQNHAGNAPGPAAEAAIRALPRKVVEKDMLDEQGKAECSICMDSVGVGDQVTVLPCRHWFHETCISAWLKEHDTCPHCRKGISSPPPEQANGSASRGSGQPSRPPRRRSSATMPSSWQGSSSGTGTARNPVCVDDPSSGPARDMRAGRDRYYHRQHSEDPTERRDPHGERRLSRSRPSSPPYPRRHRSDSHRGSGGGSRFGGWVRSLGGGGSGSGGSGG